MLGSPLLHQAPRHDEIGATSRPRLARRQEIAKPSPSPRQQHLHATSSHAKSRGNFFVRVLLDIREPQQRAFPRLQHLEHFDEVIGGRFRRDSSFWLDRDEISAHSTRQNASCTTSSASAAFPMTRRTYAHSGRSACPYSSSNARSVSGGTSTRRRRVVLGRCIESEPPGRRVRQAR